MQEVNYFDIRGKEETFKHNNQEYITRVFIINHRYEIKVFLNGIVVSPTYFVDIGEYISNRTAENPSTVGDLIEVCMDAAQYDIKQNGGNT